MLQARSRALVFPALLLLGMAGAGRAQTTTVGLFLNAPGSFEGYTLFEAANYRETYLINNDGRLVHSWPQHTWFVGSMGYLLENGHLLRGAQSGSAYFQTGGAAGSVELLDWDGNLLWEFTYSNSEHRHHHDLEGLPNGNVLMIAWEWKSSSEAIAAGRDPSLLWNAELWPEHVIEVQPAGADSGTIVWEWHVWDHLIQDFDSTKANYGVVADHPELINLNYTEGGTGGRDWLHANAIAYNSDFDQIVISVNQFSEFWIIDHGTTTAEAAGHTGGTRGMGGDLLYRWGNPQTYDRGTAADRRFYRQHDSHWIEPGLPGAGNVLVFNNGQDRPGGSHSSVDEIQTSVDASGDYPIPPPGMPHDPPNATWTYVSTPPESLYSRIVSGAQRLPNGNTLICEGAPSGTFWEVDPLDQVVWKYVNPANLDGPMTQGTTPVGNRVFQTTRYAPDFAGLQGRDLTPGPPIEIYPTTGVDDLRRLPLVALRQNYPNPFHPTTTIAFSLRRPAPVTLDIYDVRGRRMATLVEDYLQAGSHRQVWRATDFPSGVYHYSLRVGSETETRRMTVLK